MVLLLYCLLLLTIGFYYRRHASNSLGYFLAGRQLPAVQLGLSLAAAAFGGSAILVTSQLVFAKGLAGIWFSLAVALGFGCLGLFFARRIRASGAHSLADYIGQLYGARVGRLISALIVGVEICFFGLTVKSFALLSMPLLEGLPWLAHSPALFQALICAVFVAYTLLGGQKADVVTDITRLTLVAITLFFILLPVGLYKVSLSGLPPGFLSFPFAPGAGPLFALNMCVLMGLPGIVGGDVFAKVLSARDELAARRGVLLAAGVRGLLALAVALLALCARVRLPDLVRPELAIPELAHVILPAGFSQLISIVFLSALLSTGDSVLLTASTILTLDVLRLGDRIGDRPDNRVPMRLVRLVTLAVAGCGLALALWFGQVLEIMRFAYTLLTASVVMPVLLPLMLGGRRPPERYAVGAILTGLAGAILWKLGPAIFLHFHLQGFPQALDPATVGVAGSATVMLAGLWWGSCAAARS